ncbi:SigE family RNA polymerase sigma factor [Nocardioides plantarum]|uniref:SigE family RNA polymerase sigma factor n=1 Tax=Nocardioides plantarum TaxID=29299 RepID=A0ABV5K8S1_9ACTN|nr:SigE family RNA polymerase sigma factor [Nocardioides plantarum]
MDQDSEFTEWAAGTWQRLLRSAVLLGCTLPEAEDVAQSTLVRCYAKWTLVRRADNRTAYAARVLLNVHREARRKRSAGERPVAALPDGPAGPDEADRVVAVDAVRRALGDLTPGHREVVLLRYYLQLSEREIAEACRVPQGTVKSRLSRAIAQLGDSVELAAFRGEGDLR